MGKADQTCPIDGRRLHSGSGIYEGVYYDCFGCGAHYASLADLEGQAREYIGKIESVVQRHRGELEKKESRLERIMADAKERGLIE